MTKMTDGQKINAISEMVYAVLIAHDAGQNLGGLNVVDALFNIARSIDGLADSLNRFNKMEAFVPGEVSD
jgi:hypothetical protein